MYKNVLFRYTSILMAAISLLCLSTVITAQVSPHPKLLEKIHSGFLSTPAVMRNKAAFRDRGIDAPWASKELQAQRLSVPGYFRSFGPSKAPSGAWKALVILVQFSDKPQQVESTYFDNMLFGSGTGTLKDYYKKITYNNLDIITVNLPGAMGWKTAPQTYAYYCNNNYGFGDYPQNSQKLVEDLVSLVNPSVDFSQYDNNKDGYVDALFIIHTGPGAEYTGNSNDIWSHAWSVQNAMLLDGVYVSRYSVEPEYWNSPGDMTIGVYAHELGHAAFGLPDLYDYDYTSEGLGNWSLMAGGSWGGNNGESPTYPDAWSRMQMGYLTPSVVTANVLSQSILDAENNPVAYKLWKNGTPGAEYYLVENRQQTSFDQALPGGGLLIYHIDENASNNDNEWYPGHISSGHYKVALEQADGLFNLEKGENRGDPGDPFPGGQNNFSFANFTTPNSKRYDLSYTGVGIKNISTSSMTMRADFQVFSTDTFLTVISPNGGEEWRVGHTKQIILEAQNVGPVRLEYTTDNGVSWIMIGTTIPTSKLLTNLAKGISDNSSLAEMETNYTGSVIDWVIPNSISGFCKIKATSINSPSRSDQSDNPFSIVTAPTAETEPNNTRATADLMEYGESLNSAISPVGDVDYYKFNASDSDTIVVFAENRNSSTLYGGITLHDEYGNYIAWHDDYGSMEKQKLTYPVTKTGTYYIRYSCYNNYEGSSVNPAGRKKLYDPENLPDRSEKSPDLSSYDNGDYRITLSKFIPTAPFLSYFYPIQSNYNSLRIWVMYFPNGLNTTVRLDYGTTTSYGNSINLTNVPVNSLYGEYIDYLLEGLDQNTLYHYRVVLNNREGVYESPDCEVITMPAPEGWEFQSSVNVNHLKGVSFSDENNGTAVGDGTILRTTNGGVTWVQQNSGNYRSFNGVSFTDVNNGTAVGEYGTILRTTNGGTTWIQQNSGTESYLTGVVFINENIGTAVGNDGTILRTTNGGTTWIQQNSGTGNHLRSVSFADANNGIVVGEGGTILKTNDGGNTWIQQSSGISDRLYSVWLSDVNNATAAGASGVILRTKNGGVTWDKQIIQYGYWLYGISFSDANNGAAVGDGGSIFLTKDGGNTWLRQSTGTNAGFWGVSYKEGHITAVGNFGTILRSAKFLKIVSPNGGEVWKAGTSRNIIWKSSGINNVKIEYTTNNGTNWTAISSSTPASSGSFSWTVPGTLSQQCKVRISDLENPSTFDESDHTFSISLTGPDVETEPNNTMETANSISYGDTLDAAINSVGDVDYYKFSVSAGEVVTIHSFDYNGSDLDGRIMLLDSEGNVLFDNDDYGSIFESKVIYEFTASGTYYIKYAYWQNFSRKSEKLVSGPVRMNISGNIPNGAQLSSNAGDYRITIFHAPKLPPQVVSFGGYPVYYNAIRLRISYNPNGAGTTARLDYGTTANYSSSIDLIETPVNSFYNQYLEYLLKDLEPNTTYHFKLILSNSIGTTESEDYTISTVSDPEGWTFLNSGVEAWFNDVSFSDANTGTAVGGSIFRTTDGGNTWTPQSSGANGYLLGIFFTDSNIGTAVGSGGLILRTTDGGNNWIQQNSGTTKELYSIYFSDAANGTIVGDGGTILRTTDGGANWTPQSSGTSNYIFSVYFTDINNGTVAGQNGTILKTTDGGITWIPQNSGFTGLIFAICFSDINNGTAVGESATILRTTNGGNTWFPQNSGLQRSEWLYGVSFTDVNNGIVIGDVGVILRTTDSGSNWIRQSSGTNAFLSGLCVKDNQAYIVGDYGTILKSEGTSKDILLSAGWNMSSVPVNATSMQSVDIYPLASAGPYAFSGSYQKKDILETSKGYWVKYPYSDTLSIRGESVSSTTVPLSTGWNMIGIYERNVAVASLVSTPSGILTSPFYGFNGSYQAALTLEPGKGYWVKASQPGVINLSSSGLLAKGSLLKSGLMKLLSPEIKPDWGRVTIEDNSGQKATLYRSKGVKDLSIYELPPMPPTGVFDARYASDRYVDDITEVSRIKISSATYPIRIKAGEADLKVRIKGFDTKSRLIKKGESLELSSPVEAIEIESAELPLSFSLSQNYPNPFNPATTIRYTVPEKSDVTLTIYNQLGQRVSELIHEVKDAGEYEVEWNASSLSSGIYFYELKSHSFRDVKKLVLLK